MSYKNKSNLIEIISQWYNKCYHIKDFSNNSNNSNVNKHCSVIFYLNLMHEFLNFSGIGAQQKSE
jgi:hypothetical protein